MKRKSPREQMKYDRTTNTLARPRTIAEAKKSKKTREYYARKWGL